MRVTKLIGLTLAALPALGRAEVIAAVGADFLGVSRSPSAPTMGAIENP